MKDSSQAGWGVATAAALLALSTGAALAANNTIASTAETTGTATDFNFDGTTLTTASALSIRATDVNGNNVAGFLYFTPLTEVPGTASIGALGTGADFGGGTFDISTSGTSGNLLSGTFTGSVLSSTNGSTGDITSAGLNGVQYTGGSFLTAFNAKYGGSGATGDLTLDFSSIKPTLFESGGNLAAFSAEGSSTTFDATPNAAPAVPEASPASLAGFGGIGLIGLALRSRRRRAA